MLEVVGIMGQMAWDLPLLCQGTREPQNTKEKKIPIHPSTSDKDIHMRDDWNCKSFVYGGFLFKWERFIQMRMAYFAPILFLLPLFFGGRKEANRKLSFEW